MTHFVWKPFYRDSLNDTLETIMAEVPCPRLTVANSNIKSGYSADSSTSDKVKVDVICNKGYIGQGTAVCVPDGPGKKKWTNVVSCKRKFDITLAS